jgi:hypothetical protein
VLFSMLSFGALLDGLKTERRGNWVRFTVYSMLNVWSSYFAIVLVLPTVGAVTLLHIIRAWRNGEPEAGKTIVQHATVSFAVFGVTTLPLVSDLIATAEMNDASVDRGPGMITIQAFLVILALIGTPIPNNLYVGAITTLLLLSGIALMQRQRALVPCLPIIWIALPLLVLLIIQSEHGLELRYLLFVLPIVFALMLQGPFKLADLLFRAGPSISLRAWQSAVVTLLIVLSLIGIATPVRDSLAGHQSKPDWRSVVHEYASAATPGSCLIVVDATGQALYGVIQHYLDNIAPTQCALDARVPRLVDIIASHSDIWWGIGTQYYSTRRTHELRKEFETDSVVSEYFLTMLIHPPEPTGLSSRESAESFLRRGIAAVEPEKSIRSSPTVFRTASCSGPRLPRSSDCARLLHYQVAFTGLHDGYASAIGMILFAVVVVTTTVVLYLYRKVQVTY